MILLIAGASHTGKTLLAQKLLEERAWPYLSIDHLKMGLIRSGMASLSPESSDASLAALLWPITREIVRTAMENRQNLIVEGCYIPFDWKSDFSGECLKEIKFLCLIMSAKYIHMHWRDIIGHENAIERRLTPWEASQASFIRENEYNLKNCMERRLNYYLIDEGYPTGPWFEKFI